MGSVRTDTDLNCRAYIWPVRTEKPRHKAGSHFVGGGTAKIKRGEIYITVNVTALPNKRDLGRCLPSYQPSLKMNGFGC